MGYQPGDLNLYAYVKNTPFLLRDPFGLDGTINIGGQQVTVSQLMSLAGQTSSYAAAGPAEDSMLITTTGATFIAPNIYLGQSSTGYSFINGADAQYNVAAATLILGSMGLAFLAIGQIAVVIHTHQADIPSPSNPYVFSWADIGYGYGVGYAQIVVTTDGTILYKAPNSTSQTPDGVFDSNGGFHQAMIDANGNVTYAIDTSDPAPAIVADGPPNPALAPKC
jgi:hypothetical protein